MAALPRRLLKVGSTCNKVLLSSEQRLLWKPVNKLVDHFKAAAVEIVHIRTVAFRLSYILIIIIMPFLFQMKLSVMTSSRSPK